MVLLWTNDSLIKRATRYRVGPSLRLAVPPNHATAAAMKRGLWATVRLPCLGVGARLSGDNEGISDRADSGPSVAPMDANGGNLLGGSLLDSSPKAEARVRAVAVVVPPLSVTLLLSNLIKGTLVHVRAKVMNEQGAAALGEYWLTVGRWFLS
jgi:hypothetical protein